MRVRAPLFLAFVLIGCSGRADHPAPETTQVAECDAYVEAYRSCLTRLGPGAEAAIEKRVAMTRASFTANARDPADRARVAALCASGLTRLKSSCL